MRDDTKGLLLGLLGVLLFSLTLPAMAGSLRIWCSAKAAFSSAPWAGAPPG